MLNFRGIEALAYATKSQLECVGNRFLRCSPYATSWQFFSDPHEMPSARPDLLVQPVHISARYKVPAFSKLFSHKFEVIGQLNAFA
jgi:hypothetical protein